MGIVQKELQRKAFHLTGLIVPILYYFFLSRDAALLYLALAVIVAGSLEAIRLSGHGIYPDWLLRDPSEKKRLYGYFWGILSMFLAVLLFEKAIAIASLLFMLLGDSAAGIAGAITGYKDGPWVNAKPPSVMAVMFFACAASGLLLYPSIPLPVMAAGALAATVADAFTWKIRGREVNDNLSIPLVSGTVMAIAAFILSGWR